MREQFREQVFLRDQHRCVICNHPAKDAHHIMERRLWPDGGYHVDNGASLCGPCHISAERTTITVEQIREAAGVKKILPPHLYDDAIYDKWGNQKCGEYWLKGELYDQCKDTICHKHFRPWVKYPRTYHLPWSPGIGPDDRQHEDVSAFEGREVVVTEKMDGENTSLYRYHFHARSMDGRSHPSQSWVRNFHSQIAHEIPEDWRICGENLYAKHSIEYILPTFFMGFSVWNEDNVCLSWDYTLEIFELLGIQSVPVLHRGVFDVDLIEGLEGGEGYVVRVTDSFHYSQFKRLVGKYVRANHVSSKQHWTRTWTPNQLSK